jgi:hypothetical protein
MSNQFDFRTMKCTTSTILGTDVTWRNSYRQNIPQSMEFIATAKPNLSYTYMKWRGTLLNASKVADQEVTSMVANHKYKVHVCQRQHHRCSIYLQY